MIHFARHPLIARISQAFITSRLDWAIRLLLILAAAHSFADRNQALSPLPLPNRCIVWPAAHARKRRRVPATASASYSRFSTELQDETSIQSQQDRCREAAHRDGQAISPALEFADLAVSGTKLDRNGLNGLLKAAEEGRFNALYFFSLSRLARESIIGMPILKRLVHVWKVRVISVTEGLDTSREGWEVQAQILLMQHERYVKELSANTLRGQKLNIRNGFSNGDYCLGYTSTPVPGSEQTRRGRHARPRMIYSIDPVTSEWVKRIFHWFVRERRSIRWITRELNRLGAPKDHRSSTPKWRHQNVTRLLGNRKYIGDWPWGEMQNVRDPSTGQVSQEPRPTEEAYEFRRMLPELRLIDDEMFAAAQRILCQNRESQARGRNEDGEFVAGREGVAPPLNHLLAGLIVCGHCGHVFYVGGSNGKYLFCPTYQQGLCPCQTMLNRQLAEQLILEQVVQRIVANGAWFDAVLSATRAAWQRLQATLPDEVRNTEAALQEVNRKIARLVDILEGQGRPDPDVSARLAERRAEREGLEQRLAAARASAGESTTEPTEAWVRQKLDRLHETLRSATPAVAHALRDLVGGRITVTEVQRDGKKRHFLRGTFQIQMAGVAAALGIQSTASAEHAELPVEEIVIDFVRDTGVDAEANQAWELFEQGKLRVEIAQELGWSKVKATKILRRAAEQRGVQIPDGRRAHGGRRSRMPHLFEQIAPEVGKLVEEGLLLAEIADRLAIDRNTITKAYNKYRADRGLPPLDGRARRKSLDHKNRPKDSDEA